MTVFVSAPLASVRLAPASSPLTVPPIVERIWTVDCAPDCWQPFASVAMTLNVNGPDSVGVPESVAVPSPLSSNSVTP